MNKVYVICVGEYSDRDIYGVTLDREKAYRWVKRFNADNKWQGAEVEEHELDDFCDDRFVYYVKVMENGETETYTDDYKEDSESNYCHINEVMETYDHVWETRDGHYRSVGKVYGHCVYVKAEDKEHALKTAHDLIAKHKAEKAGI